MHQSCLGGTAWSSNCCRNCLWDVTCARITRHKSHSTQMHKHQLLAALDTDSALCRSRKESLALLFEDLFLRFIGTEDSKVRQPPKAGSVKPVKLPVPFVLVASAHLCPGTSSGMQPQELGWDFHGTVDLRGEQLAVSLPKWRSHLGSHNQYLQGHKPKGLVGWWVGWSQTKWLEGCRTRFGKNQKSYQRPPAWQNKSKSS